ncbi:MAG: alpha/beta hydrolase [Peptococcaceae bacterium]|nr:alpha/beta hydrolase [Peptococcaceae bacterium]
MEKILAVIPHDEHVAVSEKLIYNQKDNVNIRIKVYEPVNKELTLPGILYIHGGGMTSGKADDTDFQLENWVKRFNCVIVNVDYRLAPETPYPGPLHDCYTALEWLFAHAEQLGVNKERIGVVGHSAGGGLAAALALFCRDQQGPKLAFQMPLYPMLDDRNRTPSSSQIIDKRIWNRDANIIAWKMYLGEKNDNVSCYAAPSRAEDLSDLPPLFTFVGELDPFRDETIEYVARLTKANVPVEFHLFPGCFHAFEGMIPDAEVSKAANNLFFSALQRALHE